MILKCRSKVVYKLCCVRNLNHLQHFAPEVPRKKRKSWLVSCASFHLSVKFSFSQRAVSVLAEALTKTTSSSTFPCIYVTHMVDLLISEILDTTKLDIPCQFIQNFSLWHKKSHFFRPLHFIFISITGPIK